MAKKPLPCPTVLRQLLRYDAETGKLYWRPRARPWFKREVDWKIWNKRYAGKEAMTALRSDGYFVGRIFDVMIRSHRAAWAITYGVWPEEIDHINGDPADNRLANLRSASRAENCRNLKRPKNNTSGHVGVTRCNRRGAWIAQMNIMNKMVYIGQYASKAEAAAARKMKEQEMGFHKNHGRAS